MNENIQIPSAKKRLPDPSALLAKQGRDDIWAFQETVERLLDAGDDDTVNLAIERTAPNHRALLSESSDAISERLALPDGRFARLFCVPVIASAEALSSAPGAAAAVIEAFFSLNALPLGAGLDISRFFHCSDSLEMITRSGRRRLLRGILAGTVSAVIPQTSATAACVDRGIPAYLLGAVSLRCENDRIPFLDSEADFEGLARAILMAVPGLVDIKNPITVSNLHMNSPWLVAGGSAAGELEDFVACAGEQDALRCVVSPCGFPASGELSVRLFTKDGFLVDERAIDSWSLPMSPGEVLKTLKGLCSDFAVSVTSETERADVPFVPPLRRAPDLRLLMSSQP